MRYKGSFIKENFAVRGEDLRSGDTVLKAGKLIRPQDIAIMAVVGHTRVEVARMPVAAVISSGNELVEPNVRSGNFTDKKQQCGSADGPGGRFRCIR